MQSANEALTGGEAVVKMFQTHGLEYAFGMGGFQPLPYYDALARQNQVRHILIRDEKNGAFAADAYARITNRPALADATVGPGATNLVSGVVESLGASIPMIALTGEINSLIAKRGATQECDQVGILRHATKDSIQITRIERIPELIRRAYALATGGRPGPVHVNVPEDVFHGTHLFADDAFVVDEATCMVGGRRVRPDTALLEQAASLIKNARKPVTIVGGGIHLSGAYKELLEFVNATGIPVAHTISGKGSFAETHDLSVGLCGRYSRIANDVISGADLVLVIGCKLGEIATNRWTLIPAAAQLIHVDIDAAELGRVYPISVGVWGDAKLTLRELTEAAAREKSARSDRQEELASARRAWASRATSNYTSDESPVHMARLIYELRRALPPDTVFVADGGFATHWSALLLDFELTGRHFIANRGSAAIGYGLPGAIGAKLASPNQIVVALCGDNGFAMAAAELETACRIGAPVLAVIANNESLGYVKALQHAMYDDRFLSVDFGPVDYATVARGFGCDGVRVTEPDDLPRAIALGVEAQSSEPFVLDVRTTLDPAKMLPGIDSRTHKPVPA
jgi:acetolactate synthase-1/2/3 large subunit